MSRKLQDKLVAVLVGDRIRQFTERDLRGMGMTRHEMKQVGLTLYKGGA